MNENTVAHGRPGGIEISQEKKWPNDVRLLAILTGNLWVITFAWSAFDLDHRLSSFLTDQLQSESILWLLAISGLMLVFFILAAIMAAWSFIVGIPTCLLAVNLCIRNYKPLHRWLFAGAVTALLFTALNYTGIVRYSLKADDETATQSAATKSATLRDRDPIPQPSLSNDLSESEAKAALENTVRARCTTPKDPVLIDACAKQSELNQWQQETGKAH